MPNHRNTPAGFWSRVDRTGGPLACWLWQGLTGDKGHGRVRWAGRQTSTHRLAWELARGPIPAGLCVLHRCDVPACCNPTHLFLGTRGDNNRDRDTKGRTARQAGSAHGQAKLTEDQVREMRALRLVGWSLARLAARYDVNWRTISLIVNHKAWLHID